LLGEATPSYTAQPYQQLAAAYLAEGHTGEYRRVLIAQQNDRRERVLGKAIREASGWSKLVLRTRKAGLAMNRAVIGYGYRPSRAALWLLGIVLAAVILTWGAAHTHDGRTGRPITTRTAAIPTQPREACSQGQQIGLALRIAIPLIGNVTEGECQIDADHTTGSVYSLAGVALQALSWATATFTVAGFTNLIRRT
jgi:hypothetical protein